MIYGHIKIQKKYSRDQESEKNKIQRWYIAICIGIAHNFPAIYVPLNLYRFEKKMSFGVWIHWKRIASSV